jgi:hypothetical protein
MTFTEPPYWKNILELIELSGVNKVSLRGNNNKKHHLYRTSRKNSFELIDLSDVKKC